MNVGVTDILEEAHDNAIDLSDDDPNAVEALLRFFYLGHYTNCTGENVVDQNLAYHLKVYIVADKYVVHELRQLAGCDFAHKAERNCYLPEFADVVELVYQFDAMHWLKSVLVSTAARHAPRLFNDWKLQRFQEVARSVPSFTADIVMAFTRPTRFGALPCISDAIPPEYGWASAQHCDGSLVAGVESKTYRCPNCGEIFTASIPADMLYSHACIYSPGKKRHPNCMTWVYLGGTWADFVV